MTNDGHPINTIPKQKYKSASITIDNHEDLMAIATQLHDLLGITISINSAITILIKKYKEMN